ncbi:MAG: response regulator [Qingshengfaniella sp.]
MTDEIGPPPLRLYPTPQRPLLGMTVLLVEDSRFASEAIRLMCLRSGARIRRADCLRSARRHLAAYRPTVAVVDLGLPDGSGLELLSELSGSDPITVRLATSGDDTLAGDAIRAGAQGFLTKPVENLGVFQEMVLAALPEDARPQGPRVVPADAIAPDPIAYLDDMAHVADLLSGTRAGETTITYVAQFAEAAALSARDDALASAARDLSKAVRDGQVADGQVARLRALASQRMQDRAAI